MNWINKKYNGRLQIEPLQLGTFRFVDTETGESIQVFAPDNPDKVRMAINGQPLDINTATHYVKGEKLALRDVWHFVTRKHAKCLRAGLTVHTSAFSSTPHEFEKSPEPGFEEIFYFLAQGKGLLEGAGLWPDGRRVDKAWPFVHRSVAQVPMGWHRVVALPGRNGLPPLVSYIWCYLCTRPEWEKD